MTTKTGPAATCISAPSLQLSASSLSIVRSSREGQRCRSEFSKQKPYLGLCSGPSIGGVWQYDVRCERGQDAGKATPEEVNGGRFVEILPGVDMRVSSG